MSKTQLEALKAENAALKLRLANRATQVELLLRQLEEAKTALLYAGLEIHYGEADGMEDVERGVLPGGPEGRG